MSSMARCITCGKEFVKGEKRRGSRHEYIGYYCIDHDAKSGNSPADYEG